MTDSKGKRKNNLPPNYLGTCPPEKKREIQRMGTEAAARKCRERRRMSMILDIIGSKPVNPGKVTDIADIKSFADINKKNLVALELMMSVAMGMALKGDLKAMEFIRDTTGQKPVERVMDVTDDPAEMSIDALAELLRERRKEDDSV